MTYVDVASGDRVELSATTLENHAAKIANALRDEYDLEPGDTVRLTLPLHWQLSAWCAGVWTSGCVIAIDDDLAGVSALTVVDEHSAYAGRSGDATTIAVSMHPFGLPIAAALPEGVSDATLAVRTQPDAFMFEATGGDARALLVSGAALSQADVLDEARAQAERWGLAPGGRLLVSADMAGVPGLLAALAVPLVVDASVVIARTTPGTADQSALVAAERVTAIASP